MLSAVSSSRDRDRLVEQRFGVVAGPLGLGEGGLPVRTCRTLTTNPRSSLLCRSGGTSLPSDATR
jgi:hypothetical protein